MQRGSERSHFNVKIVFLFWQTIPGTVNSTFHSVQLYSLPYFMKS